MTGARMVISLTHELRRRGGGTAVAAMCAGGGMSTAVVLDVPRTVTIKFLNQALDSRPAVDHDGCPMPVTIVTERPARVDGHSQRRDE